MTVPTVTPVAEPLETITAAVETVPHVSANHPMGEVAGVGGMVMSVILGVLFALDRFGLLRLRSARPSDAPAKAVSPNPSSPEALEAIRSRLVGVETRLGAMEQTMTSLDSRDRADAAILARMEGMMTGWGERMGRIEAALVTGGR